MDQRKRRSKSVFKSKTIYFAIFIAFLSSLQGFVLAIPLDPLQQAAIGFVIATIIIILRFVTKVPIYD